MEVQDIVFGKTGFRHLGALVLSVKTCTFLVADVGVMVFRMKLPMAESIARNALYLPMRCF
jgi:hypothetical protein